MVDQAVTVHECRANPDAVTGGTGGDRVVPVVNCVLVLCMRVRW